MTGVQTCALPICGNNNFLDIDTTGLLIITNDTSLSKKLLLPQNHVNKKYYVTTKFPLKDELIKKFSDGVVIDHKVQCLPSLLEILDEYHCLVTINEGRIRKRKMKRRICTAPLRFLYCPVK